MKFGLKKETIDRVNKVFNEYEDVEEAILYGSRAKGDSKPGSDIDLSLKGPNLNITTLNQISIELDDLLLPNTFDLSIFHHIKNQDLLDHIQRAGRVFYKNE